MALHPDLLKILVCPQCRQPVEPTPDGAWLLCRPCGLKYEVRDDIPIMLLEEAQPLTGE
ncbi:MAG: Trm112 family protein [Deltaproteobacteria bacterium]|nr:Trm112 family protein [Deltaproteobacteria bacterium]